MAKLTPGEFKFRNVDTIGAAGAEEDAFLEECFVDTGHVGCLENLDDPRVILLGRTGAGKTALLRMLETKRPTETILISPDNLALTYVSNSNTLNFFASLGVNLDPFFKLLWRHVIVVEILSRHVKAIPNNQTKSLIDWIKSVFSTESREHREMREAADYLNEWGKDFWLETEFRVKEITQKLETDLKQAIEGKIGLSLESIVNAGVSAQAHSRQSLTAEQRTEIKYRGQQVVSKAQVRDLHSVMRLLGSVLSASGDAYYVLIDRLDENWVEEQVRYRLIMALLDTAKDFIKVDGAKVIVAMRRDLLDRVFRLTQDSGFQAEKYESLCVPITWTDVDLVAVLDRRIDRLVRRTYTKKTVTHKDLLPKNVKRIPITTYFVSRTERPRDVISFFNCCINAAPNLARLTSSEIKTAESEYSRGRLRALRDEWSADYPELLSLSRIVTKRSPGFRVEELNVKEIEEMCLELVTSGNAEIGLLGKSAKGVVDCIIDPRVFRTTLIKVFYAVGLVALKLESYERSIWGDDRGRAVSVAEIQDSTRVYVHPMFHRVLGVQPERPSK